MLASVHLADLGPRHALATLTKRQSRITAPGLRHANLALAARLGGSLFTKPDLNRAALVALWDDDAALDRFLVESELAQVFANGWRVRLQPLRAWGSWPGLPEDLPRSRNVEHDGPVAVLTMGRVRTNRLVAFMRTSAKAESHLAGSPGLIWATALARPPFVSTCSLWESSDATRAYAYSASHAHNDAIAAGRAKPFHHQEAFVRFRPYASVGHLDGKNPLPESVLAGA
jgi:heme-degrading monooxygenase HmoA